jgi:hypothetical protein
LSGRIVRFNSWLERNIIKILYVLIGAGAAIGIVSAYGSLCVSLDPFWQKGPFAIAGDFALVWVITYYMTWFAGIAWGVLFWAFKTRKTWFYPAAILVSIVGCLARGIPAVLMSIGFFMTPRRGLLFTPSWLSAILNLVILIILIRPQKKTLIQDFIAGKTASSGGSVGSQVSSFAYVLFGFGIVMMLQPFIMPTHIIDGVNIGSSSYGYLLASGELQFFSGLFCILVGLITRIAGQILNVVYSTKPNPLKI